MCSFECKLAWVSKWVTSHLQDALRSQKPLLVAGFADSFGPGGGIVHGGAAGAAWTTPQTPAPASATATTGPAATAAPSDPSVIPVASASLSSAAASPHSAATGTFSALAAVPAPTGALDLASALVAALGAVSTSTGHAAGLASNPTAAGPSVDNAHRDPDDQDSDKESALAGLVPKASTRPSEVAAAAAARLHTAAMSTESAAADLAVATLEDATATAQEAEGITTWQQQLQVYQVVFAALEKAARQGVPVAGRSDLP